MRAVRAEGLGNRILERAAYESGPRHGFESHGRRALFPSVIAYCLPSSFNTTNRTLGGWTTDSVVGHGDPEDQFTAMVEMITEDMGAAPLAQFRAIHNTLFASTIRCTSCGHTNDPHHSEERTISLPLRAELNGRSIEAFVADFLHDKISDYKCEGCHRKVVVTRKVRITSPADILTLQLKRANWNGGVIKTKVGITESLDLTKYAVDPSVPLKYELVATVAHFGSSKFGHYVAYGRGPDGRWTQFDDASTSRISPSEAMNPSGSFRPVLAYYQRVKE